MNPQSAINRLLCQLDEMLEQLSQEEYSRKVQVLSGATIGQHCRHVIECFEEMEKGYAAGIVNYDARRRDYQLETNVQYARNRIAGLTEAVTRPDKALVLYAIRDGDTTLTLNTSYYRELYHNIDHTVHHMALIRTALMALPHVQLPEDFGVSAATMKHRSAPSKRLPPSSQKTILPL